MGLILTIKWTDEEVQASIDTFPFRIFDEIKNEVLILGILRGGKVPAQLLSHKLEIPVDFVEPNTGIENLKYIIGKTRFVLFVDDIIDSGATVNHFIKLMGKAYPNMDEPFFQFWSLIKRKSAKISGIIAGVEVDHDEWFVFDWEDKDEPHERTNPPG